MFNPQQAAGKEYPFIVGKAVAQGSSELSRRLKGRVDPRIEDYDTQVEAERRDLAAVVVLGYN